MHPPRRGSAWRDNREFVGQIKYGVCYRLWNPSANLSFGSNFRSAARVLFMCQRRPESPFSRLPDDCLYYVLNMMRWDWVNDTHGGMRREQKSQRRAERRRAQQQILAMMAAEEAEAGAGDAMEDDADGTRLAEGYPILREGEEVNEEDYMEEDSSDDSEDADNVSGGEDDDDEDDDSSDEESGIEDDYQWGDHVSSRSNFVYNDEESDDGSSSEDDDGGDEDGDEDEDGSDDEEGAGGSRRGRTAYMAIARRNILQILRSAPRSAV